MLISLQQLLASDFAAFTSGLLSAIVVANLRRRPRETFTATHIDAGVACLDGVPDAVIRLDAAQACVFASVATARIFGRPAEDVLGCSLADLAGEDRAPVEAALKRSRGGQVGAEAVFRVMRPTGETLWIEARFGSAEADGHVAASLRDVSTRKTAELALRVANLELNKLAGSDALTGLANRRRFDQVLDAESRRASRSMKPLSILLLEIDRYRALSEAHGHQVAEACLKSVGAALRTGTDGPDTSARFGAEEFAVLLPGIDEDGAAAAAERIRRAVADLPAQHVGPVEIGATVTVSIGCATTRPMADMLQEGRIGLIAEADRALYQAKRLGGDRVVTASSAAEPAGTTNHLIADPGRLARLDAFRAAGAFQPSPNLHRIARMAAVLLGMPKAIVALLDVDQSVIVGHCGVGDGDVHLPQAISAHLLGARGTLVLPDLASHVRFSAFASRHDVAFLAAAPLHSGDDLQHIGGLWVMDRQPHADLDEPQRVLLSRLAALVMEDLESRKPLRLRASKVA